MSSTDSHASLAVMPSTSRLPLHAQFGYLCGSPVSAPDEKSPRKASVGFHPTDRNSYHDNRVLCKEEVKELWYSDQELMCSRQQAKDLVIYLNRSGASEGMCFRGVEKYHVEARKLLKKTNVVRQVLLQQHLNRLVPPSIDPAMTLACMSQHLSRDNIEFAHISAKRSAKQLDESQSLNDLRTSSYQPQSKRMRISH